jgi:tetratricopeptide (TPR) repeat protein
MNKQTQSAEITEQNYGKVIMERRVELGWSRELLAELYGLALRDRTVTTKAIEKMEKYNDVPKNAKRRLVLAGLLGLVPAALGVKCEQVDRTFGDFMPHKELRSVNLTEYQSALQSYQRMIIGDGGNVWEVAADISSRICILHEKVLYAGSQKLDMVKLLCGFHIVFADIASEHRCYETAEASFKNAIILAKEYKLPEIYAVALNRRGLFFLDRGNAIAADRNFQYALKIKHVPQQLRGHLLAFAGTARARTATNEQDVTEALNMMDESAKMTGNDVECEIFQRKFDEDRWHLDRAAVLCGSPLKEYRYPDTTLKELEYMSLPDESRCSTYRQTYRTILQARAYFDKEDYLFAAQLTLDTLYLMNEMQSFVHIPDVEDMYEKLKSTSSRNSKVVAEIGVGLIKAKYIELF